ncbi:MAG: YlmH/Sll1252 family protein [Culicoidibacterales bacterium]
MKLTREEESWLKQQQAYFKNNYQKNRNTTTSFLTPKEQAIIQNHIKEYSIIFDGGYEQAERKQATLEIHPIKQREYVMFQLKYKTKFHEISHRDVLGSVLSLGIERDQIGDIIVLDGIIQIVVTKKIAPFLQQNFTMIKKASFQLKEIDQIEAKQEEYEELEYVVASYRLDVFVSALTHTSRKIADELIEKGYVQVNHQVIYSGNYQCQPDDLFSIRKYGRFIFHSQMAKSKKGKYRILVLQQK